MTTERPDEPWVTVDAGHVIVTDMRTGRHRCTCGKFTTYAENASGVIAHLATHREDPTP